MTGTALLTPDDAARARARTALRERIEEFRLVNHELGLRAGDAISGPLPADVVEHIAALGTEVDPLELALVQSYQAMHLVTRDLSRAVSWGWEPLDTLLGPMLPGELWIVGATTGNGKSTFLHNWQAGLAKRGVTTLCFPLEVEPEYFRLRTACWQLNLDLDSVVCHDWDALQATEADVRSWVAVALDDLAKNPHMHVAPPRQITLDELHRWIRWGVEKCGAEVIVIDHLHRFQVPGGDAGAFRVAMTNLARDLRDVARALDVVIVCAVQLNRDSDPLDDYTPPGSHRIKEAGAIAEEAAGVLMLSRDIRPDVDKGMLRAVRAKRMLPSEIERQGCMVVTCRKHRRRGRARHKSVRLQVSGTERLVAWTDAPRLFGRELA
jgi:replicative DNA helicase